MFGFDFSWLDPNLAYFLLTLGLWLGVMAIYLAGTGVPEAIALALIIGSLLLLSAMPTTNWLAVGVLVLGASSFLLLPFFGEKWGRYAILGLALQGIGGYYLFPDRPVSWFLIGATLLCGILFYYKILVPVFANQSKRRPIENVIGSQGRVVKELDPIGTVYLEKELWRARSTETLVKDTVVVVIAQDGLELLVEKAKH